MPRSSIVLASSSSHGVAGMFPRLSAGPAGAIYGATKRNDRCSDVGCSGRIPLGAERCPRCGGIVRGEIKSHAERLDAEETLLSRGTELGPDRADE